jgi:hypothetical protein
MTVETETTRAKALDILSGSGTTWNRVGKGQRFVVHFHRDGRLVRALVKVASRGSAMVRTDDDDADLATLSGFGNDVDHVLFAVGEKNSRLERVEAYLVPIEEAEMAFRNSHKGWKAKHPSSKPNTTWVIWFDASGDDACNRYSAKWKRFNIGASLTLRGEDGSTPRAALTIPEAKRLLAQSLGVRPEDIKITVNS